jgi:hypothetical protein
MGKITNAGILVISSFNKHFSYQITTVTTKMAAFIWLGEMENTYTNLV